MRVKIDLELCQGHGRCHSVAPDLYPMDDDGYVGVETIDVPAGQEEAAFRGMNACPERAISLDTWTEVEPPVAGRTDGQAGLG